MEKQQKNTGVYCANNEHSTKKCKKDLDAVTQLNILAERK